MFPDLGPVAQWIRHLTTDQGIPGSSPGRVVYFFFPSFEGFFFVFFSFTFHFMLKIYVSFLPQLLNHEYFICDKRKRKEIWGRLTSGTTK